MEEMYKSNGHDIYVMHDLSHTDVMTLDNRGIDWAPDVAFEGNVNGYFIGRDEYIKACTLIKRRE